MSRTPAAVCRSSRSTGWAAARGSSRGWRAGWSTTTCRDLPRPARHRPEREAPPGTAISMAALGRRHRETVVSALSSGVASRWSCSDTRWAPSSRSMRGGVARLDPSAVFCRRPAGSDRGHPSDRLSAPDRRGLRAGHAGHRHRGGRRQFRRRPPSNGSRSWSRCSSVCSRHRIPTPTSAAAAS